MSDDLGFCKPYVIVIDHQLMRKFWGETGVSHLMDHEGPHGFLLKVEEYELYHAVAFEGFVASGIDDFVIVSFAEKT